MSKKQFDHIEDRIREAVENVTPSFDQEAWEAMDAKLEKEFPEKRRRTLLVWLLPLIALIIGTAIYIFNQKSQDQSEQKQMFSYKKELINTVTEERISKENEAGKRAPAGDGKPALPDSRKFTLPAGGKQASPPNRNPATPSNEKPALPQGENTALAASEKNKNGFSILLREQETVAESERKAAEKTGVSGTKEQRILPSENVQEKATEEVTTSKRGSMATEKERSEAPEKMQELTLEKTNEAIKLTRKTSSSFDRGFYIVAYGGLDYNDIHALSSKGGTGRYGLGIGYKLNRRLSIQTGLYAGSKKYKAAGYDYQFKPGSYLSTVDVKAIDAACYVFDIPVGVRYDFLQTKGNTFYGIASVSSYIMSKEDYTYYYEKDGTAHVTDWTYKGNNHFLSVAGISIGYERKVSRFVSLLAEPYIRMPLSGVGEGKVKLHSTGLLLGLKYNLPQSNKSAK